MESSTEKLLHCNLCNSRFQDIPCRLPCLHSFCEGCLVHLLDTRANDPECSIVISLDPSNDDSERESNEEEKEKRSNTSLDLQELNLDTVITSVDEEEEKKAIQDIDIETEHEIKTNDLVETEESEQVESKVTETSTDHSDSCVPSNETGNEENISEERENDPETCQNTVKSIRICSFIICPTCQFRVRLTPFDETIVVENQLVTARRVVQANFPNNHFLSHLISIRMRSTGKKDCETCKMRQNLIKDGKKKDKPVTADSLCINCDQLMCRQCRVAHDGFKLFQSHNIIDVISDESKSLFSLPFRRQQLHQPTNTDVAQIPAIQIEAKYECPTHSEKLILFCSRCQLTLCSQCMRSHFCHKTLSDELCPAPILISEAAKNERQQGKILQTELSEQLQQKIKFMDKLNELIEKSNEAKTIFSKKINLMTVQIKEAIDSNLKEIFENTGNMLDSKKEEFQRMAKISQIEIDTLKDLSTYLNVALSQALDEQIPNVIQDVNKAFTIINKNENTESITYDCFNYGDTLTSLVEKCLAVTLKNNKIEFESIKTDEPKLNEGQYDLKVTGQSLYSEGNLKHAFLGSVNELWDSNEEVLLFDVVVLDGGRIIISDFHNQSIKEFDESGHLLSSCSVEGSPTGLCVVSEYQMICALTWSKKICFIMRDPRGQFLAASSTVTVEKQYCGIVLMTEQSLLCSCDSCVDLISFDGTILKTLTVLSGEYGSLLSPRHILKLPNSEYFWLSDAERALLICCNIDGNVKFCYSEYADQSLLKPSGLSMDKDGFLYMADNNHNCIYRLTANGQLDKLLFTEKEGILKPRGLAVSADGTKIYLTEIDSGIVKVLNVK